MRPVVVDVTAQAQCAGVVTSELLGRGAAGAIIIHDSVPFGEAWSARK